jgi:hypothetical protein
MAILSDLFVEIHRDQRNRRTKHQPITQALTCTRYAPSRSVGWYGQGMWYEVSGIRFVDYRRMVPQDFSV